MSTPTPINNSEFDYYKSRFKDKKFNPYPGRDSQYRRPVPVTQANRLFLDKYRFKINIRFTPFEIDIFKFILKKLTDKKISFTEFKELVPKGITHSFKKLGSIRIKYLYKMIPFLKGKKIRNDFYYISFYYSTQNEVDELINVAGEDAVLAIQVVPNIVSYRKWFVKQDNFKKFKYRVELNSKILNTIDKKNFIQIMDGFESPVLYSSGLYNFITKHGGPTPKFSGFKFQFPSYYTEDMYFWSEEQDPVVFLNLLEPGLVKRVYEVCYDISRSEEGI